MRPSLPPVTIPFHLSPRLIQLACLWYVLPAALEAFSKTKMGGKEKAVDAKMMCGVQAAGGSLRLFSQ